MTTDFSEIDDAVVAEGGITGGTTADYDNRWDALAEAQQAQTTISAMVVDASRGGLVVDLGMRGFIPKSQIATRDLNHLERYIGQTIEVKVTEVDREKGRVVLSERKAAEESRAKSRAETMANLSVGQTVEGTVRRIAPFGAFVDIGGVDGLLHISDMAWEQVEKPEDVVKVDDQIQVKVLRIEGGGAKISLGLKQLQEDPWKVARRDFREGQLIEVTITRLEAFGAFAEITSGIEGLIPTKELSERRGDAESAVKVGQTVTVKILEWPTNQRRITLSIRQAKREVERQEMREYSARQQAEFSTPTLGDLFGDVFSKLKKD